MCEYFHRFHVSSEYTLPGPLLELGLPISAFDLLLSKKFKLDTLKNINLTLISSHGRSVFNMEANNFKLGEQENPESFEGMKMQSDKL
jgi:hypothetical protein